MLDANSNDRIIIICDEEKVKVGKAFASGSLSLGLWTRLVILKKIQKPRTEIPKNLQEILKEKSDIYINLLRGNREETPLRIKLIKKETIEPQAHVGHCPGVTLDMLTMGALALTSQEHKKIQNHATRLMNHLKGTQSVEINNSKGTKLTLSTKNREFFTDTKPQWKLIKWMNLPTGEVIVAPIEDSMNGKLVCDVAIGGIGRIEENVSIVVRNGKVTNVFSQDKDILIRIKEYN